MCYTYASKLKTSLLALAVGLSSAMLLKASVPFEYDFDTFTTGSSIVGQDGWINFSGTGGTGPVVREVATTINGSPTTVKGLGHLGDNIVTRAYRSFGNFGITSASIITLEFDMIRVGSAAQAMVGVGAVDHTTGSVGNAASVGYFSSLGFVVRGEGEGLQQSAVDSDGNAILAIQGDLYRVRSVWNLSGTGTATLEIMNLSLGETEFTQLYFNAAQTQTTANLGLYTNPSTWEHLQIRPGGSGGQAGLITDISVIPEPATYAMLFGMGAILLVVCRRFKIR
jgi:hypothetical protein